MIKTDYVSERKEGSGDGFVAGNGDGRAYISLVMAYGEDGCLFFAIWDKSKFLSVSGRLGFYLSFD
jgi:hypothetical protein